MLRQTAAIDNGKPGTAKTDVNDSDSWKSYRVQPRVEALIELAVLSRIRDSILYTIYARSKILKQSDKPGVRRSS